MREPTLVGGGWGGKAVEFRVRKSKAHSYFIGYFHVFLFSTCPTRIVPKNYSMIVGLTSSSSLLCPGFSFLGVTMRFDSHVVGLLSGIFSIISPVSVALICSYLSNSFKAYLLDELVGVDIFVPQALPTDQLYLYLLYCAVFVFKCSDPMKSVIILCENVLQFQTYLLFVLLNSHNSLSIYIKRYNT